MRYNFIIILILLTVFISRIVHTSKIYAQNITPPLSGVVTFSEPGRAGNAAPIRDYVGPNRLASDDEQHQAQNESAIFINPADPDHIVGGSNDYREGGANCGWFVSFDRGETWQSGLVDGLDIFGFSGDPTVVIDNQGIVYMGGIHFDRDQPRRGGLFVSRSEDGGLNWEDPNWVVIHEDDEDPPFEDKPFLGVDNTGGEHDGNIYISWTRYGTGQIHFSHSTDGAESWSDPFRLTGSRGQGSVPVVGPDGEIYVIWKNYSRDQVVGRMSNDGGESFSQLFVVAETDQIPAVLEPTEFRTHSLPSSGVDQSDSDTRGRVYVTWADHANDDADILLAFSDDRGDNWSEPLRLNDDEAENGLDQFFPWLSVDPITGEMSAIWYDRRNNEENIMVDVYGVTWEGAGDIPENQRISSVSFDPRVGFEGTFFGDYIGVAAYDGIQIAGWCDSRANNQDIYAASIDYKHFPEVDEGHHNFDEHQMIVESIIINGEAAEPDDEIAVFNQWFTIAGSALAGDGEAVEFIAMGHSYPGRVNRTGYINWKVWDRSSEEEITASAVYTDGDEFFRENGESTLNLIAPPPDQQRVDLFESWSLMSTFINPHNLNPWDMFMSIEDQLVLVKDQQGSFLIYNFDFSNMNAYDPLRGYYVKVDEDVEFEINGVQMDAQSPLTLDQGWNLIGYPPPYELEPWYTFDAIMEEMIIVKNEDGEFLIPEFQFSNMGILRPGEGYLMKLNQDLEFIYPEEEQFADYVLQSIELQHFQPVINSPVNMSLLVKNIFPTGESRGSILGEIAAISADGIICGATIIEGAPPYGLAIWGGDDGANFESSLQAGDVISLVYWDELTDNEYRMKPFQSGSSLIYEPDGIGIISLIIDDVKVGTNSKFSLHQVYPNPFNSTTILMFSLEREKMVDFSLYDISGRSIINNFFKIYQAGTHHIEIDGTKLNTGIYIGSLTADAIAHRVKIALIR